VRVLIIGGTRFVGRHLAQQALARGHASVLFNRGHTGAELFPEADHVRGDRRAGGLDQLAGERFDVVFDTSAYHPDDVAATAPLATGVGRYVLVSTASVYRDPIPRHADETAAVWTLPNPLPREFSTPEEYGGLKAACEASAKALYGDRTLIVRPGLVVGPHDYTDRLTSWIRRMQTREVLLAGEPDQPVQLIDARDLADWMIRAAAAGASGVFNAVGPQRPLTFRALLARAATVLKVDAQVVWAGDRFLTDHDTVLPLWIPRADHAFFEISNASALAAGLVLRPITDTLSDVATWADTRPNDEADAVGDREDELLAELETGRST
jgi:2'-hydroxyisoflavone reductase